MHVLEKSVGSRIELRLAGDRTLCGKLEGFDDHLNLVVSGAVEATGESERPLGTVVVRGNHVVSVGFE